MEEKGSQFWFIRLKDGTILCISNTEIEKYSKFIDIRVNNIVEYIDLSDSSLSDEVKLQKVIDCYKSKNTPLKSDRCLITRSLINQRIALLTEYYINPLEVDISYNSKNIYNSARFTKIDDIVQEKLNFSKYKENFIYYLKFHITSSLETVGHYFIVEIHTSFNVIQKINVFDTAFHEGYENEWLKKTILLYFTTKEAMDIINEDSNLSIESMYYNNPLIFTNIDNFEILKINEYYKTLEIQTLESKLVDTGYCSAWSIYFIWRSLVKREDPKQIYDDLNKMTSIERLSLIMIWWNLVENSIKWKIDESNQLVIEYDNDNFFDLGNELSLGTLNKIKLYRQDIDYNSIYLYPFYGTPIVTIRESITNKLYKDTINKILSIPLTIYQKINNIYIYSNNVNSLLKDYIDDTNGFDINLERFKKIFQLIIYIQNQTSFSSSKSKTLEGYINAISQEIVYKIQELKKFIHDRDIINNYNELKNVIDILYINKESDYIKFLEKLPKDDYINLQILLRKLDIVYFYAYSLKYIYVSLITYMKTLEDLIGSLFLELSAQNQQLFYSYYNSDISLVNSYNYSLINNNNFLQNTPIIYMSYVIKEAKSFLSLSNISGGDSPSPFGK